MTEKLVDIVKVHGAGNVKGTGVRTKVAVMGEAKYYSSKAVVIPKAIAEMARIKTGDMMQVEYDGESGRITMRKVEVGR